MWPFSSSAEYQSIIDNKRAQRDEALSAAPSYLASQATYDVYLKATAPEIVQHIEKGEWTATQVVEAYCARAAFAHAKTNCITEVLFDQARQQAAILDKEFAETGKLKGPLHGVPVSFKDLYSIAGYDATIGFTQWANKPRVNDAFLVAQFRAAGAIPIVKTNVPQTMLTFECSNPLWGRTLNPHNNAYTSGGSSGGEGALLAMDGSAIGLGSDIGGSLRIPAGYCGIYSLKPSVGRIGTHGSVSPDPGFHAVQAVAGPMGRSVDDVELTCRTVFGASDDLNSIAPLAYRDAQLPPKLRFGYYTSDLYVKASPACKRAVLETVEALRREGHECVEFELPEPHRGFDIFVALSSSDGYKKLTSHLGPDPQEKTLFLVTLGPKLNWMIRGIAAWVAKTILGDPLFAGTLSLSHVKSVHELHEWYTRKVEFTEFWYKEVWGKYGFDGIIAPVQAPPCLPHGGATTLTPLAEATILYNVVDSPVGVVPVTHVDPLKDQLTDEWVHGPGLGSKLLERRLYQGKGAVYNPEKMAGLPVGVQIVGKKWEDEKVIGMMHVVDKALGPRKFGPGSWTKQVNKSADRLDTMIVSVQCSIRQRT